MTGVKLQGETPASFEEWVIGVRQWAQTVVERQWLRPGDLQPLQELEVRNPGSLFDPGSHRPLVAAFFGGTGVGKSSLLNRLAGQAVARTGVERPTSREVSLYMHESVRVSQLPSHFPLDQVRIARHPDADARQILWVDMPDIDSVEAHNRELVLNWLPRIDVLIYVVSPERYRDDKGWRLLREHGGDHAWLFVMNQWDRCQDVQLEDFRRLLGLAGFRDPIVLRTDCRPNPIEPKPDDFTELQRLLREISGRHVMSQLEARAEQARLSALAGALRELLGRLGPGEGYAGLRSAWDSLWSTTQSDLLSGLDWSLQCVATAFAGREAHLLARSMDLSKLVEDSAKPPAPNETLLWDRWAESRVGDTLAELLVEAGQRGLPILPLKARLEDWPAQTGKQVLRQGQLMLRQALARPGGGLRRFLLKLMGGLAVLLPLGALGWASYQVVKGYYESAAQHLDYLGSDFAIHSVLLIALAWLLPWFAQTRLKPSIEKSALQGLRAGVDTALASVGVGVLASLEEADAERQELLASGYALLDPIERLSTGSPLDDSGVLGRILAATEPSNPGGA